MKEITQEELKKQLEYDPFTGVFKHLISNCRNTKGEIAGVSKTEGYLELSISCKKYYLHRLAWLYMTGEWPKNKVDHINRIREDNRWENLRLADDAQNSHNCSISKNSKSGYKGVFPYRDGKKWISQITVRHKT